tara:strand:+ start:80 stop:319 length:240 start_codon:yes stop_codon:yes gene_type:complete
LGFRNEIKERYPVVFKSSGKKSVSSNYGWFSVIDGLAEGDILKFDAITLLPLNLCLVKLSLNIDKQLEQQKQMRKTKTR